MEMTIKTMEIMDSIYAAQGIKVLYTRGESYIKDGVRVFEITRYLSNGETEYHRYIQDQAYATGVEYENN